MKAQYDFSKKEKFVMRCVLRKYEGAPSHHYEVLSSLETAGSVVLWPDEALYLAGIVQPYYSFLAERLRQHPAVEVRFEAAE